MALSIFLIIIGYLMGSICSAVIISRLFNLPDPREQGSRNPGATNVLRLAGKQYAVMVMVADVLKGTIPVLIAKAFDADPVTIGFTALAAVLGHMFPLFFGFKGGKGVATAIGALLGFHFIIGVMVAATWLLVANFSRYSSLASLVSISLAPFFALIVTNRLDIFPPLFFITIFVIYKHKDNITRLMDRTESKIKFRHSVLEDVMETSPITTTHETIEPTLVTPEEIIEVQKTEETVKPKAKKTVAVKKTTTVKKATTATKTTKETKGTKAPAKKVSSTKVAKPKAATKPKKLKDE